MLSFVHNITDSSSGGKLSTVWVEWFVNLDILLSVKYISQVYFKTRRVTEAQCFECWYYGKRGNSLKLI